MIRDNLAKNGVSIEIGPVELPDNRDNFGRYLTMVNDLIKSGVVFTGEFR